MTYNVKGTVLEASFGVGAIRKDQKDTSGNRCLKVCTDNS